jgi:hypothetical protein
LFHASDRDGFDGSHRRRRDSDLRSFYGWINTPLNPSILTPKNTPFWVKVSQTIANPSQTTRAFTESHMERVPFGVHVGHPHHAPSNAAEP